MEKKKYASNKIILLGSNGSIGKSLKDFLFTKKIDCIALDLPRYDITKKNFKISKNLFSKECTYTIINCIGLMGADISKKNIENFLYVNGIAVSNIFSHFKDINIKKIIQLSSETVYGHGINLHEKSKKNPTHPYSISKLIAEISLSNFIKISGKKVKMIILRLPVIVFNNQKFPNTLSIMCKDAKMGRKLIIFGEGKHYRKYLHENDLNEIIYKVFLKTFVENKINYFNLPGFKANTVEIINILKKIRKNLKIEFITKSNKAFSLLSNSSNFDEVFNYKLKINLKQMIETLYGKK
tara:strand:+ start:1223 stop:2110 length:888 start_codon:yes stop_codon:yes gene_type:complete